MNEGCQPVVVYDTGIVVQAVLNVRGPAGGALELLDENKVTVYLCPRLRSEMEETLMDDPVLRVKNPRLTDAQVLAVLQRLDKKAVMVANPSPHVCYERDPDDEPVLNLAIEVNARFLVSRDADLLDLMNNQDFRKWFPHLTVLDPLTFLRTISLEQDPEREQKPEQTP